MAFTPKLVVRSHVWARRYNNWSFRRRSGEMMLAKTTSLVVTQKSGKSDKSDRQPAFTLVGRSRAGDGSCWIIPELKWMFDCGALLRGHWKPKRIFLSHTHHDHVHFLTHMRRSVEETGAPPVVLLPTSAEPFVKAHLNAYQEMTENSKLQESQGVNVKGLELRPTDPDRDIVVRQNGTDYVCRTIACDHRIDCLGFSIFRIKHTLKEEYAGLPGREIGRLRKEGVAVTVPERVPFLCFLGDTTSAVFERNPLLLQEHKVVVVECTFLDDASLDRAKETKHIHWKQLRPFIEENPNTLFLLTHFSLKYKSLELRTFFRKNSKYKNIHPMLIESEIEYEWKRAGLDGEMPLCNCFECSPSE